MQATGGIREGEREQVGRVQGDKDTSVRERVPTAKGKEYQISRIQERVVSTTRKWSSVVKKIKKTLKDVFSPFDLRSMSAEELEVYGQLYLEYRKLMELAPERSQELNEELEITEEAHHEIAESIYERMKELKGDKASVSSSKQSRHTRNSSASSRSSARMQEAAAKVARLKKEMEYHDTIAEAEAKLAKKMKERDLAIASAEFNALKVVEEEAEMLPQDDESVGKQEHLRQYIESQNELKAQAIADQQDNHGMPHKRVTFHDPNESISGDGGSEQVANQLDNQMSSQPQVINLNPSAQSFVPSSDSQAQNTSVPNVKYTVQVPSQPAGNFVINMPAPMWNHPSPIEPNIFDGNPLEFPLWIKDFDSYADSRARSSAEKLSFLHKFTSGAAQHAISMISKFLNSETAYIQAKEILWERFGEESVIADAYSSKLAEWKPIPQDDGAALTAFSDFLRCCKAAKDHTSYLAFLDQAREMRKLLTKLPRDITEQWSVLALDFRENYASSKTPHSSTGHKQHPPFDMFCTFVQRAAKKMSCPFFSRNAIDREADDTNRPPRRKPRESSSMTKSKGSRTFMAKSIEEKPTCSFQSKVNVQASKQFPKEQEGKGQSCHFCNKDHDLDECKEFAKLDGNTRYTFVVERRLCTGCLKLGHKKMYCKRKKSCKVCQRRHPTALHNEELVKSKGQEVPEQATQPKGDEKLTTVVTNKVKVSESVTPDVHSMIVPA